MYVATTDGCVCLWAAAICFRFLLLLLLSCCWSPRNTHKLPTDQTNMVSYTGWSTFFFSFHFTLSPSCFRYTNGGHCTSYIYLFIICKGVHKSKNPNINFTRIQKTINPIVNIWLSWKRTAVRRMMRVRVCVCVCAMWVDSLHVCICSIGIP